MFLKKKNISIKLMPLKVRIAVGRILKVPVCKAHYDIASPEPKNLERKCRAD